MEGVYVNQPRSFKQKEPLSFLLTFNKETSPDSKSRRKPDPRNKENKTNVHVNRSSSEKKHSPLKKVLKAHPIAKKSFVKRDSSSPIRRA